MPDARHDPTVFLVFMPDVKLTDQWVAVLLNLSPGATSVQIDTLTLAFTSPAGSVDYIASRDGLGWTSVGPGGLTGGSRFSADRVPSRPVRPNRSPPGSPAPSIGPARRRPPVDARTPTGCRCLLAGAPSLDIVVHPWPRSRAADRRPIHRHHGHRGVRAGRRQALAVCTPHRPPCRMPRAPRGPVHRRHRDCHRRGRHARAGDHHRGIADRQRTQGRHRRRTVGASTTRYLRRARSYAAQARSYGAGVTEIYTPNATWARVAAAARGANVFIYLGHGNGWPSPYAPYQARRRTGSAST